MEKDCSSVKTNPKAERAEAFARYLMTTDINEHECKKLLWKFNAALTRAKHMLDNFKDRKARRPLILDGHESYRQFLEADVPNLLMSDMKTPSYDVDLDDIKATMERYAEELKISIAQTRAELAVPPDTTYDIDWEEYALSLDSTVKELAKFRVYLKKNENSKNEELEVKLAQLCQSVDMYSKMIKAKVELSDRSEKWSRSQQNVSFYYDILKKMLVEINETTYLLRDKN